MTYELFTDVDHTGEIRAMILALGKDNYAVSELSKEEIKSYAHKHGMKISVRSRPRDLKVEVRLKKEVIDNE